MEKNLKKNPVIFLFVYVYLGLDPLFLHKMDTKTTLLKVASWLNKYWHFMNKSKGGPHDEGTNQVFLIWLKFCTVVQNAILCSEPKLQQVSLLKTFGGTSYNPVDFT